jgi:hypothetical protein
MRRHSGAREPEIQKLWREIPDSTQRPSSGAIARPGGVAPE